jgi:hypothetical protein
MNPLENYLTELREIHDSGAGIPDGGVFTPDQPKHLDQLGSASTGDSPSTSLTAFRPGRAS